MRGMIYPCKVAVVGAGNMANEHIKAFSDIPGVEIVGIYSRTRSKAVDIADRYNIPVVADSLEELWNKTSANLVVITVNVRFIADMVRQCVQWPWKILAEKPIGIDAAESALLVQELGENGGRVFAALNRRFYSSTLAALQNIAADNSPRYIEVLDQQEPEKLLQAGFDPLEIKNWMYANSIHLIDYLRIFGRGSIEEVQTILPWSEPAPMVVSAAIRFSSGDMGLYHALWNAPGPWAVSVTTKTCRWEMRPLEKACLQQQGSRVRKEIETAPFDIKFKPGLRYQAEEAVKAALGMPSHAVTLQEADMTMQLISKIYHK